MPIRQHMKAFWWFIEGRVGGMGRPGFNQCHWFDFSLEEGVVFTWLGKQHQTTLPLDSLWQYLDWYGPRVAPFHGLSVAETRQRLRRLHDRASLLAVLESMNTKAGILQEVSWANGNAQAILHFTPNVQRLQQELELLKRHNFSVVISLLEQPLDHAMLDDHFDVYHFPVEDVTPPSHEQVYAFADILGTALDTGKNVVTHCLAGVGRTTTMFMAAYLVQGHPWDELVTQVQACNPHFQFKGRQVVFLQELAQDITCGRLPVLSAGGKRVHAGDTDIS
jgi:protein-tyrosine phosphatase